MARRKIREITPPKVRSLRVGGGDHLLFLDGQT
jgi:hypothetical protein